MRRAKRTFHSHPLRATTRSWLWGTHCRTGGERAKRPQTINFWLDTSPEGVKGPGPNFQFHASQSPWYATRGRCSRRQGCHLRLLSHLPHPQRRRSRGGRFLQHRLGGMEEQCRKTLDEVKEKKEAGSQIGVQLAELIGQNRGFKRP